MPMSRQPRQGKVRGTVLLAGAAASVILLSPACGQKQSVALFSTPDGPKTVRLELARTDVDKARGLMLRTRLSENQGMLFFVGGQERPSFWMKNTYIPLDLVFLSGEGVVIDAIERLPPCPLDPCPSYASCCPAAYALELQAGFVARHGVRKGDRVRLTLKE
jgi:uncharacterized protein